MSFYGHVWRLLPGPTVAKTIVAAVLILAVIAVLFTWVFPAIAPLMPFNDTTVHP